MTSRRSMLAEPPIRSCCRVRHHVAQDSSEDLIIPSSIFGCWFCPPNWPFYHRPGAQHWVPRQCCVRVWRAWKSTSHGNPEDMWVSLCLGPFSKSRDRSGFTKPMMSCLPLKPWMPPLVCPSLTFTLTHSRPAGHPQLLPLVDTASAIRRLAVGVQRMRGCHQLGTTSLWLDWHRRRSIWSMCMLWLTVWRASLWRAHRPPVSDVSN